MSTPIPEQGTRPDFAVVERGYDCDQVDGYVARVLEWLADAQRQCDVAERARDELSREVAELRASAVAYEDRSDGSVPDSLHAFSGRIGDLMQRAMDAAHELETQAEEEARDRYEAAETEARQLLDEARAEAERIVAHARDSERSFEEHVADLKAARSEVRAGLDALKDRLTEILERSEPDVDAGASTSGSVPGGGDDGGDEPGDSEGEPGRQAGADASPPTLVQPRASAAPTSFGQGPAGDGVSDEPTIVQPVVTGADEPTIVQPAVSGADEQTAEQPVIRRRR